MADSKKEYLFEEKEKHLGVQLRMKHYSQQTRIYRGGGGKLKACQQLPV